MSKIQFQLEALDDVVRTLRTMAGEHADMSRSLQGHAGSAQSIGADGWIVDQLRYASSLLGNHPDLFRQLSSELEPRLELAHKAADLSSGGPTALRAELTLAMTATAGLLKAATASKKANQLVKVAPKGTGQNASSPADKARSLFAQSLATLALADANGMGSFMKESPKGRIPPSLVRRTNDCADFAELVMEREGIKTRPGEDADIFTDTGWTACGFKRVASGQLTSDGTPASIATTAKLNAATPPAGSFFEMGQNADGGYHHSGVYLGSRDGYAYVAHSNWPFGSAPAVIRVDGNGTPERLTAKDIASLSKTSLTSDPGATKALLNLWKTRGGDGSGAPASDGTIQFYSPPAS